jgi:hypothetical protein
MNHQARPKRLNVVCKKLLKKIFGVIPDDRGARDSEKERDSDSESESAVVVPVGARFVESIQFTAMVPLAVNPRQTSYTQRQTVSAAGIHNSKRHFVAVHHLTAP